MSKDPINAALKNNKREFWFVKNTTKGLLIIGDVRRLPEIPAGKSIDLLQWITKQQVEQSLTLRTLLSNGSLQLIKKKDGVRSVIPQNKAIAAISLAEEYDPGTTSLAGKADKVVGGVENNLTSMDAEGNLQDAGASVDSITTAYEAADDVLTTEVAEAKAGWSLIETANYTTTPTNTSTLTMSDTTGFFAGLPIKYTIGGATYYGRILTVNTDVSVVIEGPPLSGDVTALWLGVSALIIDGSKFLFFGAYSDATSTDLWDAKNGTDLPWELGPAYLVAMTVKHDTDDTGTVTTQPVFNAKISGGGDILASNLEIGTTRARSGVTIDPDNYKVVAGQNIEITLPATAAGASPADDADTAQVELVFVRETL